MDNDAKLDIDELKAIRDKIQSLDQRYQIEKLNKVSPYSQDITSHICSIDELQFYISLRLQESYSTRPVLVSEIDPDLWIESEKATNLELMSKGRSPYAFDAPEGRIELHHIGQNFSAPFVELTQEEHEQNSHVLHISGTPSWRNNKKLENAFQSERETYWIKRARGKYIIDELPDVEIDAIPSNPRQEYLAALREICEEIYKQSEIEDLDYLADLAESYAMMRRIGALSMGEFLKNERSEQNKDIYCTSCTASNYVHYGTYYSQGENVQRYKCKVCGKIFTATARTLLSGASFSFRDWIKFIDCLYNGFTLGQIAKVCDISENAVIENRTKLFYALKLLNDRVILEGNIAIDETYIQVSYKGNHSQQEGFVMPRDPHDRGGENHRKGITDDLVCIVCAVDDCGNSVCKVAGTGNPSAAKLKYVLNPHMGEEIICLYSDKSNKIESFAKKCGYPLKQSKQLVKDGKKTENVTITHETFVINRYIQIVGSYQSRLKRFLGRFSGVSTKHLSGYLYLFAWKERNKEKDPIDVYKELLRIMAEPNNYLSAKEIMEAGYLPDAIKINEEYKKKGYIPSKRDLEICRLRNEGNMLVTIAKKLNMSPQNVGRIIRKLRKNGFACSPASDIRRKHDFSPTPHSNVDKEVLTTLIRDYQIYAAKLQWEGSTAEFNRAMSKKYGISVQRVKNVVTLIKKYIRLKEEIYIYEDVNYQTLEEVYRSVYSDFLALKSDNPQITQHDCAQVLAKKYGFTHLNIIRIIHIMTTEVPEEYFSCKRKLSTKETYNRDKALFIDFLRWSGKKSDFCRYASKKYGLSYNHVSTILKYCLYADPKRFKMV